jgi:hypothetical protein
MRVTRWTRLGIACVALALMAPSRGSAQDSAAPAARAEKPQPHELSSARIAAQLGTKLSVAQPEELMIGASLTGMLTDPTKLAALGARDARAGARVTITRAAADRVRVEVDEIDPAPRTRKLTLRVDGDGRLSAVAS